MTEPYRLLVTGSRKFRDVSMMRLALVRLRPAGRPLIVVHGGHPDPPENPPYGADRIAQEWALGLADRGEDVRQEAHPALWEDPCRESCKKGHRKIRRGISICPAAGPYRNQEMVDLGADMALAALVRSARNRGTRDCLSRIYRAQISFTLIFQD